MNFIDANRITLKEYLVSYNSNMIVEKYIVKPKKKFKLNAGYLHLLEHMIIKENRDWFTKLENEGVYFNAITSKETIEFIFFYFNRNIQINLLERFDTVFSIENLELERKTILQEKVWLDNTMQDSTEISAIIGSELAIRSFELSKLNELKNNLDRVTKITFSNNEKEYLLSKKHIYVEDFQHDLIRMSNNDNHWINENDLAGKLLLYFFNIVKIVKKDSVQFKLEKIEDHFKIITDTAIKKLNKRQIFSRYLILLNNFKLFEQEMTFIIDNFSAEIENIEELFMDTQWELMTHYE